jgi:hypothetical protein
MSGETLHNASVQCVMPTVTLHATFLCVWPHQLSSDEGCVLHFASCAASLGVCWVHLVEG